MFDVGKIDMKEILELICIKGQELRELEIFKFFQDKNLTSKEKMLWVPYFAPFIMGFSDLNKSVFRKEPSNDQLQKIINQHTYEDDSHWMWFLQDVETLGLNKSFSFNDSLRFIWSDKTKHTRQICQKIALHVENAEPVIMLIAMLCIEETFKVGLSELAPLIQQLEQDSNVKYSYFGANHLETEKNHSHNSIEMENLLKSIQLTTAQMNKANQIVDLIFMLMSNSLSELLVNAHQEIMQMQTV